MRPFYSLLLSLCCTAFFIGCSSMNPQGNKQKPNILFIAIDDMNDWAGFLGGHPQASTPNLDKFAEKGINFTNAHCPAPGCSPSRNALLYGVEPYNSGLYPFYEHAIHEQLMEQYTSLPRFFKKNGYETFGAGKIHHGSKDDEREWTEYLTTNNSQPKFKEGLGYQVDNSKKMSFRPTFHADEEHFDYQVASYGVDVLSREHNRPFFLAVGIVKPHLPFDCPVRFFNALPDSIEAPAILKEDLIDIPLEGKNFRRPGDDHRFRNDNAWEDVWRAYLACISWVDFNIGRVLDELENSPFADNTIVVVWSDHGFHLGEKMTFRKFTLWEEATRVPFIIYDGTNPGNKKGQICKQPVSLINIYRTLADMAGLPVPEYVDGESLVPQLLNPNQPLSKPAVTSWGRGNYAVRSENWRYIKYFDGTEELYSHEMDPHEWYNLAHKPEYEVIKNELSGFLPKDEAATIEDYIAPWSLEGADRERLKAIKQ